MFLLYIYRYIHIICLEYLDQYYIYMFESRSKCFTFAIHLHFLSSIHTGQPFFVMSHSGIKDAPHSFKTSPCLGLKKGPLSGPDQVNFGWVDYINSGWLRNPNQQLGCRDSYETLYMGLLRDRPSTNWCKISRPSTVLSQSKNVISPLVSYNSV